MSLFYINLEKDTDSRYDLSKFLRYSDNYDPLTSDILNEVKNLPFGGQLTITSEEFRPDTVSRKLYGDFQYWWIILFYNGMTSVDELKTKTIIQYPEKGALENYYFSLNLRQLRTE
jgi:hypothetical protein